MLANLYYLVEILFQVLVNFFTIFNLNLVNFPDIFCKSGKSGLSGVFRLTNLNLNAIFQERSAMLERLMQAALITFLLHLIAALNPSTQIPRKSVSPVSEIPAPVLGSTIRFSK